MQTPSQDYRRTGHRRPEPLFKGLDARVYGAVGFYERRGGILRQLHRDAEAIDALAARYADLNDHQLHKELMLCREAFRRGGASEVEALFPALAAIREKAHRQLGLRPFLVQLMGALALYRGYLAEMATGEGKTLTAGLAAVLGGWNQHPCHIVTVNDYLVQRDAEWMGPLYRSCGVRVGHVTAAMELPDRRKGHQADVTYTTSKELLADFLRDRLRLGTLAQPTRRLIRNLLAPRQSLDEFLALRGLHRVIVDEADSLLIDEAVTPLIISSPRKNPLLHEAGQRAQEIVSDLEAGRDYKVNLRYKEIELTPAGRRKLADSCSRLPGLWRGTQRRQELIRQALVAREFFHKDQHYVLNDGKVVIVDEFTGRPMPQRTWREGLHQAIEAKEGLELSDPSETVARLSFQRFFRCFHHLAGMTGTAREAAGELWQIYGLPVVSIPTNRPCIRRHLPDRVFATEEEKFAAVVEEVRRLHERGQPILVGTRSVRVSETLGARLQEQGLSFRILNAIRLAEEAQIVALAGERGHITIATNMAGRGTDIKLGRGVAELGGLHVLATERHESRRVDRQLFGRSGRQGDPGTAQAFVSAEDELIRRYLPRSMKSVLDRNLAARLPGWRRMARSMFSLAQRKAQTMAYKQRKSVLKTDTWMEEALSFTGVDEV